jgi:hypothetical protein
MTAKSKHSIVSADEDSKFKLYKGETIDHNYLPNAFTHNPSSSFENHVQFHIENGQYQAAGYLLMYGLMSRRFSDNVMTPIADVGWRRKLLNSQRSSVNEKDLNDTYWAGPTNFLNRSMYYGDGTLPKVIKADINAAYSNYLLTIKKPGVHKKKYQGFYPTGNGEIVAYKCRFSCRKDSLFADWFVIKTEQQAKAKKVIYMGDYVQGEIMIFSSSDMPLLEYATMMLPDLEIVMSYVYSGPPLKTDLHNVRGLVIEKNIHKNAIAKNIVNSSMGWRALLDKSSFYHMVQFVKYQLLDFSFKNGIMDDVIGVATDALVIRITKENESRMLNGHDSVISKLAQYVPPNEAFYREGVPLGCGRFDVHVVDTDKLDGRFITQKETEK